MGKETTYSSLVGVRAAGKSTVGALICLTAQDMSSRRREVSVDIREITLDLRGIVADLLAGMYPGPTGEAESFVSEIKLRFRHKLPLRGASVVAMALADVAGESLREVMDRFAKRNFELDEATLAKIRDVNRFILTASSFMIAVDLDRMLLQSGVDRQDAQLARFADSLLQYKAHNNQSPKIEAVAVLLTKYDRVEDLLSARDGIHLRNPDGRIAFLSKYMIQTAGALKNLPTGVVELFYSFCESEVDAKGDATNRIKLDRTKNRPVYSVEEYERLIEWIRQKMC